MGPRRPLRRPRRRTHRIRHRAGRGGRRSVPRALPREGRRARRAGTCRRRRRARADRVVGRPTADVRAPPLRDEHGRPDAGRARRTARGEGRGARDPAPVLPARVGGRPGRRCGRGARRRGARPLAPPSPRRPGSSVRTSLPSRRRRSSPRRPSPASGRGRDSTRSSSARCGSRWRGRTSRSRQRWRGSTTPTATCAAPPPRRSPRRSAPAFARGRSSSTRSWSDKSIDDRLRGYPTWISSRNLANETTDEAVEALIEATTSRYDVAAALLPPQGAAARSRPPRPLRPHGADRGGHEQGVVGRGARRSSWTRTATSRTRRARSSRGSSTTSWIDAPVRPDKRTGAFCATTVPGVHPYILMNYTGDRRSILTLAHELGHGLHGVLVAAARPLQLVDAADDRGDRVGVRRGAHVRAAARRRGRPAAPARPAGRGASRTRSRRRSARSR